MFKPDFADVSGLQAAKRAAEIAAAGGHHLLLEGPPGSGKTMLARRIPGILPPMSGKEHADVLELFTVVGLGPMTDRPFRAPHFSASPAGVLGGGAGRARPGEVALANHGVLFLDDLHEFSRAVAQGLGPVIRDRRATLVRATGRVSFAADFLLVASLPFCVCGERDCRSECGARFRRRTGPLREWFDLRITLSPDPDGHRGDSSEVVQARVAAARERSNARSRLLFGELRTNADLRGFDIDDACGLNEHGLEALRGLQSHDEDKVLRVARTIADLDAENWVQPGHIVEAARFACVQAASDT